MKLSQSKISVMASTATRIAELMLKHLRGELSESEEHRLNEWKNSSASRLSLFDSLTNADQLSRTLKEMYDADLEAGWQKLQALFPATLGDAQFPLPEVDEKTCTEVPCNYPNDIDFETQYDDRSTSLSAKRSRDVERLAVSEERFFTANPLISYDQPKDQH
jgi:hypothetical protein